jgi:hypothetical protein
MMDLNESVTLEIRKSSCLILFELLTRSYESWRKENPEDSSAGTMTVNAYDHADRVALWHLEGALERTLPELFSSNYKELLKKSRTTLGKKA